MNVSLWERIKRVSRRPSNLTKGQEFLIGIVVIIGFAACVYLDIKT